jgi:succinyl-diaminopimelate desuccinylase
MNARNTFYQIMKKIETYREDMIRLQIELTAIPALAPENGGDGEHKKALFLTDFLHRMGFEKIFACHAPDNRVSSAYRPNLILKLPGENTFRNVWIMTHLDVVPPGELKFWEQDPYRGFARDGRVYGRGTEDNQQDMVASIFAAKAFLDEGILPKSTIGLLFASDEETGSKLGLEYVLAHHPDHFDKNDFIVVPDFGNEEGTVIDVAEKSILWLRFQTTGKQCHASQPTEGINAFAAASHLVVNLQKIHKFFDGIDPLYQPSGSTFEPTKKEANVPNINTIPGEDVFYLDCRVLPRYNIKDVLRQCRKMADNIEKEHGVQIEVSSIQSVQAPPPTAGTAPVVRALQKAIREVYGVSARPVGIGGGTVAAAFRQAGYPAAVWCRIGHTAHQANENCLIDNMIGNAKVYAHLFMQD